MTHALTPKQDAFCLAYLETSNASEAYRRAYDAKCMKDETIAKRAIGAKVVRHGRTVTLQLAEVAIPKSLFAEILADAMAGQTCPVDRLLAFFDPLLRRASSIVELRHPRSRPRQVGDDETDARVQLAGIPLDLGYHSAGLAPGRGLVAEAIMKDPDVIRRSPDGARQ